VITFTGCDADGELLALYCTMPTGIQPPIARVTFSTCISAWTTCWGDPLDKPIGPSIWSSVAVFAANEDPFGAASCSSCTAGYARIEEALIEPANTKKRDAEPYH
jgi:hypothetical protein